MEVGKLVMLGVLTGEKLSQSGFYVVALDLRGHGDSDWDSNGDYSINAYKDDLASIIQQLDKPASLVGASLGGMASLSSSWRQQDERFMFSISDG